jgi:hypothetical protein
MIVCWRMNFCSEHPLGLRVAAAPGTLVRVHAFVGEAQRKGHAARLLGHDHDAAGRGHGEARALLEEGRVRLRDARVAARKGAGEQRAELVAAQAVGLAVTVDRQRQCGSEPPQQSVAGGVPVTVVVALESVQVEEHERGRPPVAADRYPEVVHQPPPVAEAGQGVRHGLVGLLPEHSRVLEVGERRTRADGEQRAGREADLQLGQRTRGRGHEQPERDEAEEDRDHDRGHAQDRAAPDARRSLPGREGEDRHRGGPHRVEDPSGDVRALCFLVEEEHVGGGEHRDPERQQQPLPPRAPAGERKPDGQEHEQQQVAEQI